MTQNELGAKHQTHWRQIQIQPTNQPTNQQLPFVKSNSKVIMSRKRKSEVEDVFALSEDDIDDAKGDDDAEEDDAVLINKKNKNGKSQAKPTKTKAKPKKSVKKSEKQQYSDEESTDGVILLSNSFHSSIKQTTYQQPNPPIINPSNSSNSSNSTTNISPFQLIFQQHTFL